MFSCQLPLESSLHEERYISWPIVLIDEMPLVLAK